MALRELAERPFPRPDPGDSRQPNTMGLSFNDHIDDMLRRLDRLIEEGRFEEIETESVEFKPCPANKAASGPIKESVCAFLNSRGGFVVVGVKDTANEGQRGTGRRYVFTGYRPESEGLLKTVGEGLTDRAGKPLDVMASVIPPEGKLIRPFRDGLVAIVRVNELPADKKFAFFEGKAYRRHLTGDEVIGEREIAEQEEFKAEAFHARELDFVPGAAADDLDLGRINAHVVAINQGRRVVAAQPDLESYAAFLESRYFLRGGKPTVLGMLVCGADPARWLGFRTAAHCYVKLPEAGKGIVFHDKQDYAGTAQDLAEETYRYLRRNILVGISTERSGSEAPQYPDDLLRETVNNAFAHRDYRTDLPVSVVVRPGESLEISNPGCFRPQNLVEGDQGGLRVLRVVPEARARNPKLAAELRPYDKWEGQGVGMSKLVDHALQGAVDLPYFVLKSETVSLFVPAGKLVDEGMERLFESFGGYFAAKLPDGLDADQKAVLAYLVKSEWANREGKYAILLTYANNHARAIAGLEAAGLIFRHPASTQRHPVFVADRVLAAYDPQADLVEEFGPERVAALAKFDRQVLGMVVRFHRYSLGKKANARQVANALLVGQRLDAADFQAKVRRSFQKLSKDGYVRKVEGSYQYEVVR